MRCQGLNGGGDGQPEAHTSKTNSSNRALRAEEDEAGEALLACQCIPPPVVPGTLRPRGELGIDRALGRPRPLQLGQSRGQGEVRRTSQSEVKHKNSLEQGGER